MDEINHDMEKMDDVMLPGFRFHPTDEELVGFYLKRKVQQRTLSIELIIKQVDIYKYDPWDLPKVASTGEKEWYFYCPRDRKYRNSTRPNRVTGSGFWKATGTDRPIYSSEGTKCIGLKKSLVFYRGRAAKGIKTDWMMHEFRLPSLSDSAAQKKFIDKNPPANDAWAICRIFKKTNTMTQRALSHTWVSTLPEPSPATDHVLNQGVHSTQLISQNNSCTTNINSLIPLWENDLQNTFYKPSFFPGYNSNLANNSFLFAPPEQMNQGLLGDVSKGFDQNIENSVSLAQQMQSNVIGTTHDDNVWASIRNIAFPFESPTTDTWKPNLPIIDNPSCPNEMSTTYSANISYTS